MAMLFFKLQASLSRNSPSEYEDYAVQEGFELVEWQKRVVWLEPEARLSLMEADMLSFPGLSVKESMIVFGQITSGLHNGKSCWLFESNTTLDLSVFK